MIMRFVWMAIYFLGVFIIYAGHTTYRPEPTIGDQLESVRCALILCAWTLFFLLNVAWSILDRLPKQPTALESRIVTSPQPEQTSDTLATPATPGLKVWGAAK